MIYETLGHEIVENLLFIGMVGYLTSAVMFSYIFMKTLRVKDGVGLLFLRVLTLGIALGSIVIFAIRFLSEYGNMSMEVARAIAVINPLALVAVALYLSFLFNRKYPKK